jgi:rhamnulose-1-phosphate aldolase/alcohol dehydrogenase
MNELDCKYEIIRTVNTKEKYQTKNLWNDNEFSLLRTPLEQRVYSSRLLGKDPHLVMHGGGNTSVKDSLTNLFGEKESVIFVKGSGWDLATIQAEGFPAVRLSPLMKLKELKQLDDLSMMNELRRQMWDSKSCDPSVETLLHAFIPETFIDHTHAEAVLTLTNQPNGEKLICELYGKKVGLVPYIMPGFQLALKCLEIYEQDPTVEGLILIKHGVFTFGNTAKDSYERMIALVQKAEDYLTQKGKPIAASTTKLKDNSLLWATSLRKKFIAQQFPMLVEFEGSSKTLAFVNHPELKRISSQGPLTPDHVIRTKRIPAIFSEIENLESDWSKYIEVYTSYFSENSKGSATKLTMLDPYPRIILVPGTGMFVAGKNAKEITIAKDLYQQTMSAILKAESIGNYQALPAKDIFDVEYWVLEQAKLKLSPKKLPLSGKVVLVTGGASGIGLAMTETFLAQGAEVAVFDNNLAAVSILDSTLNAHKKSGNKSVSLSVDISDRTQVKKALETVCKTWGGLDAVVVNAGVFPASQKLEDISESEWNKSLSVNVSGSLHVVAESLKILKNQNSGGDILFIASKNAVAPGKEAGAYSIAKAAQTQLARVCALEAASAGIRVNVLHPHLVFDTALWSDALISARAKAYGMTQEEYMTNNLLKTKLTSHDVAQTALAMISGYFGKTTGAQIPVDGGSDRTL